MLETFSPPQESLTSEESKLELPPHVDVSKLMAEKNAFFVHMIQVTNMLDVSENNKSGITTKDLSVADKLDLVYGVNPTLSASTLRPHTKDDTFYGGFGVIVSHGEVEHAATTDTGSTATSLYERAVIGATKEKEDVDRAIDRDKNTGGYNEIVLKNPEVAGGFMKLSAYMDRVSYEEEQHEYYDGETVKTKIGVIDMKNTTDRYGNLTASYDKPFSVLVEMSKRGRVFVKDDENQMYTIKDIDEANRKVRFVGSPVEPKDFAHSYGTERMNKYAKAEMKDRLQKSLEDKGMSLPSS